MKHLVVTTPDDARIAVTVQGSGPPLLLVTGLGGMAKFWIPAALELERHHTVITFDHRAIGASTRGTDPVGIDLLADDVRTVLDAAGVERTLFLGHSMGGAIGQSFVRQHPDRVSGLVLSGTWLKPNRFMQTLFTSRLKLLEADPAGYAALGTLMGYPPDWLEANWGTIELAIAGAPHSPQQMSHAVERINALLAFDGSARAGAFTGPVLVQGAKDDMIVPSYLQDELAAALPGAARHVFADGGHLFPVSRTPEFVRTLRQWIGSV